MAMPGHERKEASTRPGFTKSGARALAPGASRLRIDPWNAARRAPDRKAADGKLVVALCATRRRSRVISAVVERTSVLLGADVAHPTRIFEAAHRLRQKQLRQVQHHARE